MIEKKRLFGIMSRAKPDVLAALAKDVTDAHEVTILKAPGKALAMVQMREPVRQGLFYIGEVIVCEAVVELDGTRGVAVAMGDDTEKTLNMAVIDAAVNNGCFAGMDVLLAFEKEQADFLRRENALHLKTMVNFQSMDGGTPHDVNAYKKT